MLSRSGDDPSGAERDLRSVAVLSVFGYGVDETISVFAVIPYFDKRLEMTQGGAGVRRDGDGVGDIRLFGRYTLLRSNWTGKAFRFSAFAGLETPSGDDDDRDGLGRVPAVVQAGSGSWDPFAGLVATYQTLDFQIDGQVAYQANTEANGFEFGDVARADASFQ